MSYYFVPFFFCAARDERLITHFPTYQLTESSSFDIRNDSIEFKSGGKGDDTLTMTAINEYEHQHWCYALDIAIARLRNGANKVCSHHTFCIPISLCNANLF